MPKQHSLSEYKLEIDNYSRLSMHKISVGIPTESFKWFENKEEL